MTEKVRCALLSTLKLTLKEGRRTTSGRSHWGNEVDTADHDWIWTE
ncbi:MAG: hypothetical protein ACI9MB_002035, partial [Verrucomicrobiales bacterium]